jgi:hypothetical protein
MALNRPGASVQLLVLPACKEPAAAGTRLTDIHSPYPSSSAQHTQDYFNGHAPCPACCCPQASSGWR